MMVSPFAAAAAIKCPRQVVLAGKDRMAPRKAGMELVEHLDGPELTVIEESGHMIPQEAPNRLRKLLRDFEAGRNRRSHVWYRWFNEPPVLVLFAAVILAVVKPF